MTHRVRDQAEVELKFELDSRSAKELRRHPALATVGHQTQCQSSIYFDTDDCSIRDSGYSLRVRQVGDCFTQTVKSNGGSAGLFDRGEWEADVDQMAPDPTALKRTPLRKLRKLTRDMEPVIQSDVERSTWLIDRDGSVIEAALDSGTITAGDDRTSSFQELELELRVGQTSALFDFARELGQEASLSIGVLSKEQRGRMLADGSFERETKAAAIAIERFMDAGQVFALIVHECIRHFRLNEPLIVAERDPHALHQARVAMRRLRAAFSLFRPAIRQGALQPLRRGLREFIKPFGEARNLDVFLDRYGDALTWRDRRKLTSARADAYDEVVGVLKAQRSRGLLLDLVEWTTSGVWRKDAASMPIEEFAAQRLDAMWKKVKRKGVMIGDLQEKQVHRLRISIKNLRYTVEFLAPLYAKKRVRKFASSLADIQDWLGRIHDDIIGRQISADFALRKTDNPDSSGRARQLRKIEKRFKRLKGVDHFWAN